MLYQATVRSNVMSGDRVSCMSCIKMEYGIDDGLLDDFDFAEDAMDYELQLAEARDVKFTLPLAEPPSIGSHIICTGKPTEDLPWFAVNMGCNNLYGRLDIAVHFNVRLPQQYVVRNTRRNDRWGAEETTAFRLFPFKMHRPFTIEILIDEKETLFAVDGEFYCSYLHRNPSPLAANYVQITGVRDATINIQKTDIFPMLAAPREEVPRRSSCNGPPEGDEPAWHSNIIAKLSAGIPEGQQLVIHGRLRPLLHSFAVELLDCAREWPPPNVLLHANLRAHVDSHLPRQLLVLNAWLGGWGAERRQRAARLVPGSETTLRIVRGAGEWAVYTDDTLVGELEHRAAPAGVRAVRLRGDLCPRQLYLCPSSTTPERDA